jgi:hypothetical protein
MANLGQHFDATTVDPNAGFSLVPPGKYVAHIVLSDMRPTRDGTGQYLYLELEILEGPEKGKRLFERLNLVNANDTTVRIAQQTLSQICHAIGVMSVSDSEQLHVRRMIVDVRISPPKGEFRESNRIVSYSSPTGATAQTGFSHPGGITAQAGAGQPEAPGTVTLQKSAAGAAPPWRTRAA